jgi:RimJ/RimL family protein N-acetyltransferase
VKIVVLWVLEANERARSFYEKCGWIADGAEKRDAHRCGAQPQLRYRRTLGSQK